MNDRGMFTRRGFTAGALAVGLGGGRARAQGLAGLSDGSGGYAAVVPGKQFTFPADHGPHPDFRIEWWYLTANLTDASGAAYGLQWTLFRQAMRPGAQVEGWANPQAWLAHTAVTRADTHRSSETVARGGVGQAGVEASPFHAFIDAWEMRGLEPMRDDAIAPLSLSASAKDFAYALRLDADQPLVLQGDAGYSRKSERGGQASYYYSQPFFKAKGSLTIDDRQSEVTGLAWMDREWSSQPLEADQTGWDWFALHFNSGERLMLYRLRQKEGPPYSPANWITPDGSNTLIASADVAITPLAFSEIAGRRLPTRWRIAIDRLGLSIDTVPLNPNCWMATSIPYWEGPIRFEGSHAGVGYLEMTGY